MMSSPCCLSRFLRQRKSFRGSVAPLALASLYGILSSNLANSGEPNRCGYNDVLLQEKTIAIEGRSVSRLTVITQGFYGKYSEDWETIAQIDVEEPCDSRIVMIFPRELSDSTFLGMLHDYRYRLLDESEPQEIFVVALSPSFEDSDNEVTIYFETESLDSETRWSQVISPVRTAREGEQSIALNEELWRVLPDAVLSYLESMYLIEGD